MGLFLLTTEIIGRVAQVCMQRCAINQAILHVYYLAALMTDLGLRREKLW